MSSFLFPPFSNLNGLGKSNCIFGDTIEHLEIVVRAARPTVEQQQRSFLTGLTHNAVVGVVSHKRHIAFCNYVVHDDDDGFKMLIEFLISGTKIRISKEKAKSFLSY